MSRVNYTPMPKAPRPETLNIRATRRKQKSMPRFGDQLEAADGAAAARIIDAAGVRQNAGQRAAADASSKMRITFVSAVVVGVGRLDVERATAAEVDVRASVDVNVAAARVDLGGTSHAQRTRCVGMRHQNPDPIGIRTQPAVAETRMLTTFSCSSRRMKVVSTGRVTSTRMQLLLPA